MLKKFLILLTGLLMLAAAVPAVSGALPAGSELTTIYLEKSASSTRVYPSEIPGGDFIRFRALFIGDDGTLAGQFNGTGISGCDVEVSLNITKSSTGISESDIEIAWAGAEVEPMDIFDDYGWDPLPETSSPDADGFIEFAISVNDVRTVGTVVLDLRLTNGSDNETTSISFDIVAPEANGYVVRTGAVTEDGSAVYPYSIAMPDVGEEVAGDTENYYTGIPLTPSEPVTVNVFAVYASSIHSDTYIFTDNVPEGADSVVITGGIDSEEMFLDMTYAAASAVLADGYVSKEFTITDLKVPELLSRIMVFVMDMPFWMSISDYHLLLMSMLFEDGIDLEWRAAASVTREVGPRDGDTVNALGGGVLVDEDTIVGTVSTDTSYHGVGDLDNIMMVGLPVNTILNSMSGFAGFGVPSWAVTGERGSLTEMEMFMLLFMPSVPFRYVSPLDAYLLLDDPTAQPVEFRAVCSTESLMFGALLGWDAYDNPAPLSRGNDAYFVFNDGDLEVIDVFNADSSGPTYTYYVQPVQDPIYYYGMGPSGYIQNQAFIPFAIVNDEPGTITNVYISDVSGSEYAKVTCVEGSGVDFIGDIYASQLTVTLDYSDTVAGEFNGMINASAGKVTQTYVLDKAFYIEPELELDPMIPTEITLTRTDAMEIAAGDPVLYGTDSRVAFDINSAMPGNSSGLFVLEGANGAMMITATAITETITAGPVDSIELQYPGLTANVVVGHLDDNDLIRFAGMYKAYDEFGNEIREASGLAAGTTDTAWALPTAENSLVARAYSLTMNYDISLIDVPAAGTGYFQAESADGTITGDSIEAHVRVIRSAAFMPLLTAESQIDVPVLVYLADQAGNRVAPPDDTVYELDITTDNDSNMLDNDDEDGPASDITVDITSDEDSDDDSDNDLYAGEVVLVDAAESLGRDGIVGMTSQGSGILGFTNYDLQLESDYDYEAPDIDIEEIEDGLCTIIVHVTDNVAVDIEETIASIELYDLELNKVLDGEDNASEITGVADGTGATITISVANIVADDGDPQGAYELHITAIDEQGNDDDETIVLVDVDVCLVPPPECVDVNPFYLEQGESGTVVITALNTAFTGSETVTACSGVTVGTISATSDTTLSVALTVAATATAGDCALEVDLGDEIISCLDFTIVEPTCEITASPSIIRSGWLLPRLAIVSIVGNEDCDEFTFANSGVAFDDAGMIPLLPIPIFGTIVVPTLVWPGTEGEVTVTVDGEHTDTIDVEVGILP